MATYENSVADTVGMQDGSLAELTVILSDTFGLNDVIGYETIFSLAEKIGVSETLESLLQAQIGVADGIGLQDALRVVVDLVASDSVGIQDTVAAYRAYTASVIDGIIISGVATSRLDAYNVLAGIIGLVENVEKALDASILEQIGLSESTVGVLQAIGASLDVVGLQDSSSAILGIYIELDDSFGVDDVLTTNAILEGAIQDGLIVSTTILGPGVDDVYTGWVMNSENFAVTNYGNFKFTDMAQFGGNYYGVKEDGVFLLDGNTDQGVNIGARIATAAMEFGNSNMKTITQMYLGLRGDGNLVVKMISDEDEETWYQGTIVDTTLRTERLTGAKGQAGRYWQVKIVSNDSTKLDLDTIELFPIVWGRKL